jgi:hypothetical protein
MDSVYANGLKIKDIIKEIDRCQELKLKNPDADIQVEGLGYNGCTYF